MRKSTLLLLAVFLGGALSAAVPNRITYQGRLFKSGVAVSGSKSIRLALVHPSTLVELESEVFNVTLPATGEFTIVWDTTLDPGFDWRGVNPQLKISVDGEALEPERAVGGEPVQFCGAKVDVGGVDTAALADGAVTNAKVAVGVESTKILMSTSPGNTYLSDWRHPAQLDKIDASKVFPPLAVDSIIFSSPSVAQFIQASQPVTPLTIKGKSGVVGTVPVFDVRDNADILRFRIRGAGEQYFSGPIGVGTEAPGAPIDLVSSSAAIVMRNTQAPEATRTWQMAVNNTGKMQMQATNAALGSPVTALTLSRDGSIDIPTARITSSTIQDLTSNSLVTQNLTATNLGFQNVSASSLTVQNLSVVRATATTVSVQNLSVVAATFTAISSSRINSSSATLTQVSASNVSATTANIGSIVISSFSAPVPGGLTVDNLTVNNSIGFPAVAAKVSGSSSINLGVGGLTQITFQTEDYDTSNIFDPTFPSRLKAPRKGIYLVNFMFQGDTMGLCVLRKNGVEVARFTPPDDFTKLNTLSESLPVLLNQNDYLEVYVERVSAGATLTTRSFHFVLLGQMP
jgi:hypothetical protein